MSQTVASTLSPPGVSSADFELYEQIASGLERDGYVVLPGALPGNIANSLLDYLAEQEQADFHRAAIGRGLDEMRNSFVRRDRIRWIEEGEAGSQTWLQWANALRLYLNRRLFLGLFSFESHFSFYQPGDFYKTHLDAFRGESNRVLSLVTYLNRGWEPDQGGELVIYGKGDGDGNGEGKEQEREKELLTVQPGFATLVLFLSEEFPHEVRPTRRERFAVAGWYRVNGSVNEQIDPPR
jgi:SM-20-related protein